MLGKVMKYEFRSSARLLLPFFGLAIVFSAFLRLLFFVAPFIWAPAGEILTGLAGSLGVLLLLAVILVAFCAVIVRFYQGMIAGEAYLSFTLPVKIDTHILGRSIVGTLYSLLSVVVAIICGFIFIPGFGDMFATELADFYTTWGTNGISLNIMLNLIGMFVVFVLVAIISNLLKFYASLAIGTQLGQNRILGGIGAYLLLNIIEGIVMAPLVLVPVAWATGRDGAGLQSYISSLVSGDPNATLANIFGLLWAFVGLISVITLAITVVHYFLTRHFLGKKLNLE